MVLIGYMKPTRHALVYSPEGTCPSQGPAGKITVKGYWASLSGCSKRIIHTGPYEGRSPYQGRVPVREYGSTQISGVDEQFRLPKESCHSELSYDVLRVTHDARNMSS